MKSTKSININNVTATSINSNGVENIDGGENRHGEGGAAGKSGAYRRAHRAK